jgi:predicted TIM-barrel fold metal-dependent hydrolase
MRHFVQHYGPERLLLGSDFPFGAPGHELRKVEALNLSSDDMEQVLGRNVLNLVDGIKRV